VWSRRHDQRRFRTRSEASIWWTPSIEPLNSLIPPPSARPNSGSRLAPNTNRTISSSTAMWSGFAIPMLTYTAVAIGRITVTAVSD
jgi:hypothetical protein